MQPPKHNKVFLAGFGTGLIVSIVFNYVSYLQNICSPNIDDCGWSFGFPVHLYLEGGLLTFKEIIWFGLGVDVLFAFGLSLLLGFLFSRLWP